MSDELLPCPFCGGKPSISPGHHNPQYATHLVTCRGCNSATASFRAIERAVAAWNRRAGEAGKTVISTLLGNLLGTMTSVQGYLEADVEGDEATLEALNEIKDRLEALEAEHKGSPQVDGGREIV